MSRRTASRSRRLRSCGGLPCPASTLEPASGPPSAVYPLSIDRRGHWRARLPAGCARLALVPEPGDHSGFGPAALELLGLLARSCMDAGPTSFPVGATVVVRVTDGRWQLQARFGELVSPHVYATMGEDATASGLVLHLCARNRIRGRVVSAGRPIAAALGMATPLDSAIGLNPALSFTTSTDGSFELRLDHQIDDPVHLVILARGLPVAVFRREFRSGLVLSVPSEGGRLELRPASGSWRETRFGGLALVDRQGALLPVIFLLSRREGLPTSSGRRRSTSAWSPPAGGAW